LWPNDDDMMPPINTFTLAGIALFIFFVGSALYANVALLM